MNKSFLILAVLFFSFLFFGNFTEAQITIENPLEAETFEELIDALINFIFTLALVIAPIMIMVAAFYFITAAGDPKRIETAKQIITYTLIGLLIVFLARGFIAVIREVFLQTPP